MWLHARAGVGIRVHGLQTVPLQVIAPSANAPFCRSRVGSTNGWGCSAESDETTQYENDPHRICHVYVDFTHIIIQLSGKRVWTRGWVDPVRLKLVSSD